MFLILGGIGQTEAIAQRAIIALDGVEIYTLPMVDKTPLTILKKGDAVRVIGQRGDWVKVEFAPGKKGWMQIQVARGKSGRAQPKTPNQRRVGRNGKNGHADKSGSAEMSIRSKNGHSDNNESLGNGVHSTNEYGPDIDLRPRPQSVRPAEKGRFGYSFGLGALEADFSYAWKFVFHTTPRLALVGSFKHALGTAANSYFVMANWDYLLKEEGELLPYVTGGVGIINTVPERSIDLGGVSHMAVNYGFGARKKFTRNTTLLLTGSAYTVFVGKGTRNFKEFTLGLMVGRFWD